MQRITITLPDSLAEHLRSMGWLDAPEFVLKTPQNQTRYQSNWLVLLILRWLRSRRIGMAGAFGVRGRSL